MKAATFSVENGMVACKRILTGGDVAGIDAAKTVIVQMPD
jgi:hypothetical protein